MKYLHKLVKTNHSTQYFWHSISLVAILTVTLLTGTSCSFFENKMAVAMVKVYAGDSVGQGIILEKTGYVVTNLQVVTGTETISIELKSGERYDGKIICVNQKKEIAIIRMQGNFPVLQPAIMGDSDLVHQYDESTVSGYPVGSRDFVSTKGTIVALPKSETISYLQTNAALKNNVAGSALLNKTGEIIGMVSWNTAHPGQEGYALTINEIKSSLADAQESEANPLTVVSLDPPSIFTDRAIISWKTNRPSTSIVEYGLQATYGNKTSLDDTLLESHGVVVQNLQSNTLYHFRVRSIDGCGNEVLSKDYTFTTVAEGEQPGELKIINANVYDITSSAFTVSWLTSKVAGSSVSTIQDNSDTPDIEEDSTPVYEHKFRINGLDAKTRYHLIIKSETEWGESVQQEIPAFTTLPTAPIGCKINYRISDFHFKTLQDTDFTNADIEGHKVFMIFTKTTCPTCMKQALFLNDIYKEWPKGDNLMMFLVASSEKKSDVEEWIEKYGLTVPVYMDNTAALVNDCRFRTIPSILYLDTGSVIRDLKGGGFDSRKTMEEALKQLSR